MKKFFAMILTLGAGLTLAGCNTVEGMGKDIERGGEHIQNASTEVKTNM